MLKVVSLALCEAEQPIRFEGTQRKQKSTEPSNPEFVSTPEIQRHVNVFYPVALPC